MRQNTNINNILGIFFLTTMFLAACQAAVTAPEIVIEDAWGRPSPKVAAAGAFYMVIKNKGGEMDRLIGGESPSCGTVELHETYDKGDSVMGMRPVEGGAIEISAGGQAELKMGGFHIMCIEKLDDFDDGAVLVLTLDFEKSGEIEVNMEIRQPDM